jgi:hypothetical protein
MIAPAHADTAIFTSAGEQLPFTVPSGVSRVHVVAVGGRGGSGSTGMGSGGFGAIATADVPVTPGQVLYIDVAGNGGDGSGTTAGKAGVNGGAASGAGTGAGGAGGGGGGGGASDVRTLPLSAGAPASLASRLIVAAGGGGGSAGGANGAAAGADASGGGGAGTPAAGGHAGAPNGGAGVLGVGGTGGDGSGTGISGTGGGGGGGGGWYGGGGGGSGAIASFGGGGGSTAFASAVTGGSSVADTTGTPSVTLSYVGPPTISITSPANGAAYTHGQVVSASYACSPADASALSSCAGPVASGAAIDTTTPGPHGFTVTALDQDGGNATATSSYTVSAAPSRGIVTASVARARTGAAGPTVSLRLACTGDAGATCKTSVALTVIEHRRGKHLVSVSAAKPKHERAATRTVTVGSVAKTLSSGQSTVVTVKLNVIGRRLLARFHHFAVVVRVTQATDNGKPVVVARQRLVLRAPAKSRKNQH